MTSRISKLVLAAAVASSLPAAAAARDCDHDGAPPSAYPAPQVYAPPTPAAYYDPTPPAPGYEREGREGGWRHGGWWRAREIAHVREEIRDLDQARAEFYARPHRRWELWRFERWYGERRVRLERRLDELQAVAWR